MCSLQCGLLPNFHYPIKYSFPSCSHAYPNVRYDPHLQDFCNKWGNFAPHICRRPNNPCEDIHVSMCLFDKYSKPPLFETSECTSRFRHKRKVCQEIGPAVLPPGRPGCVNVDYSCERASSMVNRTIYGEDVVCGSCPPPDYHLPKLGRNQNRCELEFPFEIYQCPEVEIEPIKIRSGAERCLHPSNLRCLTSSTQAGLPDFYKTKSRKQIELFRAKYAIDHRRPPLTIPCNEGKEKTLSDWPIVINAKCTKWKGGNMRPNYDIFIPNPMIVEKLDFSLGSLERLNTKCKTMPVMC